MIVRATFGIESLPRGKRRTSLPAIVERMFSEPFAGRILPFTEDAARVFAVVVASRNAAGLPISPFDAMIAAIAR